MKRDKEKKLPLSYSLAWPITFIILTLFLGVGYAKPSSEIITSNITINNVPNGVHISNIEFISSKSRGSNLTKSSITTSKKTMLNAHIVLSNVDLDSKFTASITVKNYNDYPVTFEEVITDMNDVIIYDNPNIVYHLNDEQLYTFKQLESKETCTFEIIFEYSDEYKKNPPEQINNKLTAYLQFKFNKDTLIQFDSNNDTGQIINKIINYNGELPILDFDIPSKDGYTFLGWFDNIDNSKGEMYYDNNNTKVKNNTLKIYFIKLYAHWKENEVISGQ